MTRALVEDVKTTEDAAHQLAFFEGIGTDSPDPEIRAMAPRHPVFRIATR